MFAKQPERPYDLMVYGATGFTGKLVAEYLAANYAKTVRIALGGRDKRKLESVKEWLVSINPASGKFGILVADSFDRDALEAAVKQVKVVVSTVGPYMQYGIELVGACARNGTHYADLTGETAFVEDYTAMYEGEAKRTGAKLVSMCGFDSIPSDLGTFMVAEYFRSRHGRPVAHVKSSITKFKGGFSGGTVRSVLGVMELPMSRVWHSIKNPYSISRKGVFGVYYDREFCHWQGAFLMAPANRLVVRRSNTLLSELYGPSFTYAETMSYRSFLSALVTSVLTNLIIAVLIPLVKISITRRILLDKVLPHPGSGPTLEAIESGHFTMELIGESEPESDGSKHRVKGVVRGYKDPSYGETAKMLAEAGLALILDCDRIPWNGGGCLTPATAMGGVLIDRLRSAGMVFQVMDA